LLVRVEMLAEAPIRALARPINNPLILK
jgi:hypothetical protein